MEKISADAQRILVVEDEPVIGDICGRVLAGEGFEVDIASNGKIAQDMIEEKQYDLCLIDIWMPDMDGKELYRWLTGKHPKLITRVIFTTGSMMDKDVETFLNQTAGFFLPKPFTPDQLKTAMKEVLEETRK